MGFETIVVTVKEGIATIALNRPQQLNALNRQMFRELDEVFDRVASDPGARVVVITGTGDRAFAAGADIREFVGMGPVAALDFSRNAQRIYRKLETIVPLYYKERDRYAAVMRHAISLNGSFFNTQWMLLQYLSNAYFPAEQASQVTSPTLASG